jgi:hypothetical protein
MGDQIATRNSRVAIIILSALLVGTLDLSAAFTDYYISSGKNPIPVVSKYIASGVFGTDAFSGGNSMIVLGILFHYFIASSFTVFFFWLYTRTSILPKNKILTAILYGIFMWIVTVLIIIPLSNVPPRKPLEFWKVVKAISILIVMIGIPLVLIAGKYFRRKGDPQIATA